MRQDTEVIRIHGQMELTPAAPGLFAMFFLQPLSGAVNLQPGAVDKDMGCSLCGYTRERRQPHCPPADGGMVGHREGDILQAEDRRHQAFSLTQGDAEGGAQHQASSDGEVGKAGLPAGLGAGGCLPLRNGLRGKPEPQAATLPEASFVL